MVNASALHTARSYFLMATQFFFLFASTSSGIRENTQTFTRTDRTVHLASNLLQSQGCFAIRKEVLGDRLCAGSGTAFTEMQENTWAKLRESSAHQGASHAT